VKRRVIYLSIIIVGLLISFGLARNLYVTYQNSQLLTSAKEKLDRLRAENLRLKEEHTAASDPNFIEREARNRLGLVRPGETVVILPASGAAFPSSLSGEAVKPTRPVWQQWLGLFFGV